ncbi:MAG: hypothetical protein ABI702_22330 [Burkholderiales bacterium]
MRTYPATVNAPAEADIALRAAVDADLTANIAPRPAFTSEDFAFMLRVVPDPYLWLGQGRAAGDAEQACGIDRPLHHPAYDFNDRTLPLGIEWFCALVERVLGETGRSEHLA